MPISPHPVVRSFPPAAVLAFPRARGEGILFAPENRVLVNRELLKSDLGAGGLAKPTPTSRFAVSDTVNFVRSETTSEMAEPANDPVKSLAEAKDTGKPVGNGTGAKP